MDKMFFYRFLLTFFMTLLVLTIGFVGLDNQDKFQNSSQSAYRITESTPRSELETNHTVSTPFIGLFQVFDVKDLQDENAAYFHLYAIVISLFLAVLISLAFGKSCVHSLIGLVSTQQQPKYILFRCIKIPI